MILVFGDIHGEFSRFNQIINSKNNVRQILQCGDFGYWPRFHNTTYLTTMGKRKTFNNYGIKNKDIKIYFCDGNHEDHESLAKLENNEIMRNVFYMKRGTTLALEDGRVVLFMGGASSIDQKYRIAGHDWFSNETISQRDIDNLPDVKIDIVISHTCPREFFFTICNTLKENDSSMDALSYVLQKYRPTLWYFGHFHTYKRGTIENCKFTALGDVGSSQRSWIKLENI